MRHLPLSARLTLALSIAAVLLLGAVGAWQLAAEQDDLRRSFERDLALLGRALQVAFENALRDRQAEDVEETLRALERIEPSVDVYVYDHAGNPVAASTGARPRPWSPSSESARVVFREHDDPAVAELVLPLRIARGEPTASLVLVRPLADMHADLEATRRRALLSLAAFVTVVALMTMLLSHLWVGAPLARMIAHMRRVRAGDLSPSPLPTRRDEVGATLREFEALVRDLADARHRLETEAEARRRLELALREMDKLATIGQLAAGLAHEIGSPLQILEGRVAALESKADDPAETRRLARILREQAQRITRIVTRLIGVARRPPIAPRLLDPVPPLRTVVELLETEARKRKVELSLEAARDVPMVRADADGVQQLALNLLRNALDATEPGGRVVVRVVPAELTLADGRVAPAVRFVFQDTGHGMGPEARARAFEPFFTTRARGAGLGLAVVKGIVDEHGGRIDVRSEEGRGTTFVVELPCAPDERTSEERNAHHGAR